MNLYIKFREIGFLLKWLIAVYTRGFLSPVETLIYNDQDIINLIEN